MSRATRSIVESDKQQLPKGWKTILAHGPKDNRTSLCYISPTGKRFYSLEAVKSYILEIEDDEIEDNVDSDKRKIVPFERLHSSSRKKLMNNNKTTEDCEFKMSPEIKRRRKQMSMKNPFKDLLKRTLKKTHARNLKSEMLKYVRSLKARKYSVPSFTQLMSLRKKVKSSG